MGFLPPVSSGSDVSEFPVNNLRWSYITRSDEPSGISLRMQGDDSGNGLILSTVAGQEPSFQISGVNGLPAAGFSGSAQWFVAESASDWAFLNRPPCSGAVYVNLVAGLNSQTILRTKDVAAGPGMLLLWDGGALRLQCAIYDSAGVLLFHLISGAGSVPAGNHVIAWRVSSIAGALGPQPATPQAQLFVDNVQVATASIGAGAVGATPAVPLVVGLGFAGVNNFTGGRLRWGALWDRWLSTAELTDIYNRRNTITSRRSVVRPWLMGDSITLGAQTYRRWLDVRTRRTKNLFKLAVGNGTPTTPNHPGYDPVSDGVNGNTIANMLARVNAPLAANPTHIILLAGTNDLGGSPPIPPIISQWQNLMIAMKNRFPTIPAFGVSLPRGTGGATAFNASVDAFNAALPAACAAVGATFVNFYSPVAPYPYNDGTDPSDGVGHPTPLGGVKQGNNIANSLGWGSD